MPITLVCAILSVAVHGSNPIIDAATYTTLVEKSKNGVLYRIVAPDAAPLDVLHVFGSPYERGEAHGRLLSAKILEFVEPAVRHGDGHLDGKSRAELSWRKASELCHRE